MKEFRAYIKDLKETGDLADCIGMFLICLSSPFAVILITAIFG